MDKSLEKIAVIGIGKLGLCLGLNLARKDYYVIGIDINETYVDQVNDKKFVSDEQGVTEMLLSSDNFKAYTDIEKALEADLIFVVVATPSLPDGSYNHSYLDAVADRLVSLGVQKSRKEFVICCTTMPGYSDRLATKMGQYNFKVSYNPEFIAQGTIIRDQRNPDMVLIGEADTFAGDKIESVYRAMVDNNPRYCRMTRKEAEITKIALNCFLTTKIAYANMVGDIAIASDCNPQKILTAIGEDSRIGNKYLRYGYGFGGPCFPRDNKAFGVHAESVGVYPDISYATDAANKNHLNFQAQKIITEENGDITFDYVSYKPESTIIEESQQLALAVKLAQSGCKVYIKERQSVINTLKNLYGDMFQYTSMD